MPKESKKFINPLLRPSQQEAEPKREPPPPERSVPPTREHVSRTQTVEQDLVQEERARTAPPSPPASTPAEYVVVSNPPPAGREPTRSRATKTEARSTEAAKAQENAAIEQASNHVQAYEPRPETIRARPNHSSVRPEPYTSQSSIATMTEAVAEPATITKVDTTPEEGEEEIDDAFFEEEPETDFTVTTKKARRKRGEQAFEKTHIRFTVWVDKNLKQSFEDIASKRDKTKTTLLNEAIADLVRKYEAY